MSKRVFVTGGSGFVGSAVIEQLLGKGWAVHALVNRTDLAPRGGLTSFKGEISDAGAVDAGMAGCDAAIHLVGIIFEKPKEGITYEQIHVQGTRSILAGAARNNVARYVHMSALGTRANAASRYHQTKWAAEELVRTSHLQWTIFRPSLIHGPGGEFTRMQAKWARKAAMPFLFMPYFGAGLLGTAGAGKLQPVYVEDVARAFVEAIENPRAVQQTYCIGGPEVMTWPRK